MASIRTHSGRLGTGSTRSRSAGARRIAENSGALQKQNEETMRRTNVSGGFVVDWATQAAEHICSGGKQPVARIAAVIATFAAPLTSLLSEAKREHHHSVDGDVRDGICCPQCCCESWLDDPEADFEPTPNSDEPCTCGADDWNARIDAIIAGSAITKP